ncbi:MAG: hypothetical protein ABSG76_24275, partial [Xanthobacteraceae bacterium]
DIDVFASDGAAASPWASSAHRLDALGETVAAEFPSLQLGLELSLIGVLTAMSRGPASGATPEPARSPASESGTHLPSSLFPYLLGNRIDHAGAPATAVHRIASTIGMTEAQLREHVDHLNALADVALEIAQRGVSRGAPAGSTFLRPICGFWGAHLDPGPCLPSDVFVCNAIDVHY